jgi:hypothetical protein
MIRGMVNALFDCEGSFIGKCVPTEGGNLDSQVAEAVAALDLPDGETLKRGVAEMFEDNPKTDWRAHIEAVVDDLT